MKTLIHSILLLLIVSLISCSKNKGNNDQLNIKSASEKKATNVIFLLGDGLGIPLITAAYNEKKSLNLARFPYSGLVLTQTADKFVTESGAAITAMTYGYKTNYGYQGLDAQGNSGLGMYDQLKKDGYKTAILTSSFIADATLAALYRYGTDRYMVEDIALDYIKNYPDFCLAGGQVHFDQRSDGLNLLDSLLSDGVQLFYDEKDLSQIQNLPAMGLLHPTRPPYLMDGRSNFLEVGSLKALDLLKDEKFFLFIESAHIDLAGHDNNLEIQLDETMELDRIAGHMINYAQQNTNTLVVLVSDHDCGGLNLLQGEGMSYVPDYASDEHSGHMVAVFAYGPGAEKFSGIMDNTDIYHKLTEILNL
jgi:alkaline phosphatase